MIGAIVGARRAAHRASYDNGARRRRREMERALSADTSGPAPSSLRTAVVQARRPWTSEDDQALSDAVAAEELAVQSALGDDAIGSVQIDWTRVAHAVEQATATGGRGRAARAHARACAAGAAAVR